MEGRYDDPLSASDFVKLFGNKGGGYWFTAAYAGSTGEGFIFRRVYGTECGLEFGVPSEKIIQIRRVGMVRCPLPIGGGISYPLVEVGVSSEITDQNQGFQRVRFTLCLSLAAFL